MFSKTYALHPYAMKDSGNFLKTAMTLLAYEGIPVLRSDIQAFLDKHQVSKSQTDKFLLTVSEIVTNLLKHPAQKAKNITVSTTVHGKSILMDIADDSTPFVSFNAKCNILKNQRGSVETMRESGYGLKCILDQHANIIYQEKRSSIDGFNHFIIRETIDRKKTIFLVDDDPFALATQTMMLEEEYNAIPFSSGKDALAAYPEYRPALIISDLHMPFMNGEELRKALSSMDGGDATPFVFLSALGEKKNSPEIAKLGIDDFLQKPVDLYNLRNVVTRLLTRAAQTKNAVEKAFHQDLNRDLKPAVPDVFQGWRFYVHNKMSEDGGGDFIIHEATDHCLTVILADVMGHGRVAKFFTYAYAGYIRSLLRVAEQGDTVQKLFGRLSSALFNDEFLSDVIVTCQGFQVFADGRIVISSAGHPPPLLAAEKEWRSIDCTGPIPGLSPEGAYSSQSMRLRPGQKIIFGSDGFFDGFGMTDCPAEILTEMSGKAALEHIWKIFEEKRHQARLPTMPH
jgi:sigma-B regulation protein RsbU (phosphoserine phosphatase)